MQQVAFALLNAVQNKLAGKQKRYAIFHLGVCAFLRLWMDRRTRRGGWMDGWRQCQRAHRFALSLSRSLAHQLVFPISPIHIAQSLMAAAVAAAAAGRGHGEQSKWLPQPASPQPALPPRRLFWSGWMDGSWPPSTRPFIVGVMQL